jgi:hypothetical protein
MRQAAFTAVELLCALTLSTALLVSVLGVTTLMMNRVRLADVANTEPEWLGRLEASLRWEFLNSTNLRLDGRSLSLVGYASRGKAGEATRLPVEIRYETVLLDDRTWLVRFEKELDELSNSPGKWELVAAGIDSFAMIIPAEKEPARLYSGPVPKLFEFTFTVDRSPYTLRYCQK